MIGSLFSISDLRMSAVEVVDADVFSFKQNLASGCDPGIVQVFEELVLGVDGNALSAGEFAEIDAVAAAAETEFDPIVYQSLFFHTLADTHLGEQVHGALFQDTGAHPFLDILAAAIFYDDGIDAVQVKKMRENETGWSRTDNPDLCAF